MNEFFGLSLTTNYITPPEYMVRVRDVLGRIDLDPASNPVANQIVGAEKFYTKEDDGLSQDWYGKVYMNHPWGKREVACKNPCEKKTCIKRGFCIQRNESGNEDWITRLVTHYEDGLVDEAICLVAASTSEKWFQPLFNYHLCFTNSRIAFLTLGENGGIEVTPGNTKGSVFAYLGVNPKKFQRVFSSIGTVVQSVH